MKQQKTNSPFQPFASSMIRNLFLLGSILLCLVKFSGEPSAWASAVGPQVEMVPALSHSKPLPDIPLELYFLFAEDTAETEEADASSEKDDDSCDDPGIPRNDFSSNYAALALTPQQELRARLKSGASRTDNSDGSTCRPDQILRLSADCLTADSESRAIHTYRFGKPITAFPIDSTAHRLPRSAIDPPPHRQVI